ncbi:MAG: CBS domain-containing protein, partial [Gammaproteobacteria bacterium]
MTDKTEQDENDLDNLETRLQEAIETEDKQQVGELVDAISSNEALRQVSMMEADERDSFISLLEPGTVAELIEEAPSELALTIIRDLDSSIAARIMEELHSDTQADIVKELKPESSEAILSAMEAENAESVRMLAQYDPDTAGGLMEVEAFTFTVDETVGAVLNRLIEGDESFERYRGQHPYIVDDTGKLIGVVSLRDMLRSRRSLPLAEILHDPIAVSPDTGQRELAEIFNDNPFLGIPVVDANGILLGVVSRQELAEAELERAEHESRARQQVSDELRSMPTVQRSRRRLAWLSSNIVLNIIAASVISVYEDTLAAVIAIAVFLPMVSDMSGCSGNQAVGVSMRE